jgi:type IV secretion system protein VirB3
MADALEDPIITPLVKALTQTPTLWGVPYIYFMFIGVVSAVVFLATKNLLTLAVILPLYAIGRIMVARDKQIFEILMIRGRKCPPRNRAFWGGADSYRV